MRRAAAALLAPIALALLAGAAAAQVTDTTVVDVDSIIIDPRVPVVTDTAPDTVAPMPMTPRGAFIRSMILPGWGQSGFGAHFRGGVYFAGWAGNWFMIFKTYGRLDDARGRFARREAVIIDALVADPAHDFETPEEVEGTVVLDQAIRDDELGNDLRKLVRAREQQREDWVAFSLFWLLASGVDAYVTAHLSDFPDAIDVEPDRDGSVTLRMRVPLGAGPPGRRRFDPPPGPPW